MTKIAVITACFNSEKFVRDCLESVARAITNNEIAIEHILVDDASTDRTREIINQYPVKKIFLGQNVGAAAARNRGVAATSADYLFMLDSDDVIFQNSLRYLAAFAQKEHASWVFGDFLQADEQLKYAVGCDFYGWFFPAPQDLLYSLLTNGHFFQQNCFYTRQLFLAAGGFDESLKTGEDFDLFVRFTLKNVEAKFFPGPLYIYRRRRDSLAAAYRRDITPHKEDIKNLYYKYQDQIVRVLSPDKLVQVKRFISTIEEEISARRD